MNTFEIIRLIGETPKEFLNFTETSLLTRMAIFGNREGKNISPGIKVLLKQTKLSRMPLIRALGSLVKKEFLIICYDRSSGGMGKSRYDINVPLLQKLNLNNYEEGANKSYEDKLKSIKNPVSEPKIYSPSGIGEIPLSGIGEIPLKADFIDQVVSERYQGGIGEIPLSGIGEIPIPYTQFIEPIYPPTLVEFALDDFLLSAPKKSKKIPKPKKEKKNWSVEILEVFEHWVKIMNHPGAKFDEARKRKIKTALADHGYSVEELKKAIDGNKKSTWHQGNNPGGVLHDSIDLIFRNPGKIETFISIFDTEGAVKNNNATTGLRLSFTERNKSMVNAMAKLENEMFPEFSNSYLNGLKKENLLTFRKEQQINE